MFINAKDMLKFPKIKGLRLIHAIYDRPSKNLFA